MKRMLVGSLALMLATTVAATDASAQGRASFMLGGGLTLPLGDFGDVAKLGWHGLGGVEFAIPNAPVGIRIDGMYGQNNGDEDVVGPDAKAKLFGANADVVWNSKSPGVKFYVLGGVGFYNVKFESPAGDDDESKFAVNGGAGLKFGAGAARFFVEGRFVNVFTSGSSTNFIPVTVGVSFGGM